MAEYTGRLVMYRSSAGINEIRYPTGNDTSASDNGTTSASTQSCFDDGSGGLLVRKCIIHNIVLGGGAGTITLTDHLDNGFTWIYNSSGSIVANVNLEVEVKGGFKVSASAASVEYFVVFSVV